MSDTIKLTHPTAVRTIPKTPVCPAYDALHVFDGSRWNIACEIDGRICWVVTEIRTSRPWRGLRGAAFTVMFIRYADDGSAGRITASDFAKRAKTPAIGAQP